MRGLIASVLGLEQLTGDNWTGVQLLNPVITCAQEMSMLGKGWLGESKSPFNRPTSVELVVRPYYRIYYAGDHLPELEGMLREGRSHYHTYLGSAYCLAFPRYIDSVDADEFHPENGFEFDCKTVVPSYIISRLLPVDGAQYGRVGGMQYEYLGERRFRDTVNVIYEGNGKPMKLQLRKTVPKEHKPYRLCTLPDDGVVCLW